MVRRVTQKVDSEVMIRVNRRIILQLIRQKHLISRAELVKFTGLAAPTVSRIVDRLVNDENLVRYGRIGDSSGGRPPVILEFNSKGKHVLGIDLGATLIRGVMADLDAEIEMEVQLQTDIEQGYQAVVNQVVAVTERLLAKRGLDTDKVIGVGIGVPGLLDKAKRMVTFSSAFNWNNVKFKEDLEARIKMPIFVENSTRLMALGEKTFGQGKDLRNFIIVNAGHGIAAGTVVEGQLSHGGQGFSGEFGHMTVDPTSPVICDCGRKGCLEALASGRSIALAARQNPDAARSISELCQVPINRIEAKTVFEACRRGDPNALSICMNAIEYLSIGVANLIHLLDPTHIFIGGGLSLNGDEFWNPLTDGIRNRLMVPNREVKILPAEFKEYDTVVGSLAMVLDAILGLEIG